MSQDIPRHPTIRLRPKQNPKPLRHGFPWVYANQLVMDRRTKALAPGSLATLEDENRQAIALVTVNPASKIAARVLDPDPDAQVTPEWITARVQSALKLREQLFDAPFYRLIHAEADGFPGVIVDRFDDVLVVQPNAAWIEDRLDLLCDALCTQTGAAHVLKNASGRGRALEGLDDQSSTLRGQSPAAPVPVPMNGATYLADLTGGQKTGLFFDQRPNHAFAAQLARDATVLDLFSHVGGFGLACLSKGARHATCVDASAAALALAQEGAERSGVADRFETSQQDAFDALTAFQAEGRRFDVVICDPPAFAPAKTALDAGLRAYERIARLASNVVEPGGILGLCSCSHAADLGSFRAACIRGIGKAGRQGRLIHTGFAGPDHPTHPHLAESGYLKALFFAL